MLQQLRGPELEALTLQALLLRVWEPQIVQGSLQHATERRVKALVLVLPLMVERRQLLWVGVLLLLGVVFQLGAL